MKFGSVCRSLRSAGCLQVHFMNNCKFLIATAVLRNQIVVFWH